MTGMIYDRSKLESESSLLNWYPKIEGKIPTPGTEILTLNDNEYHQLHRMLDGKRLPKKIATKIITVSNNFTEPFFLRSDQASGKHDWKNTCFVTDRTKIMRNLRNLVEWHACAGFIGLYFTALVFREYLPLQSQFTAFNDMPVAPEWRYFVKDGVPVCRHFYWPYDAIVRPSREDWKPVLHNMQFCKPEEDKILGKYATIFAENNSGFWSVDFALTRDRGWVMIDAARGEISWHPADCEHNPLYDDLMKSRDAPSRDIEEVFAELGIEEDD